MEQKNQSRARVKIAVFFVLAVHGIGLMALLMQGCKQGNASETPDQTAQSQPDTNTAAASAEVTNPPVVAAISNPVPARIEAPVIPPVAPPPATATEYTVVSGDTPASIAKKFNIKTKALLDANQGLKPTALQINQKLHIPAPVAAPAPTTAALPPTTENSASDIYTVKSNDNLTTIAKAHGTSVKALRAANNLTSDRIVVGQKLKLPARTVTAPSAAPSAPVESNSTSAPGVTPSGR